MHREERWYLFADDRTLGVQEDPTRKLLPLINAFSEVTAFKINPQKLVTILYIKDKHSEKRTGKHPGHISHQRIKYLEINLTKEPKDL